MMKSVKKKDISSNRVQVTQGIHLLLQSFLFTCP
uniref:Uncharacterized protein n=1 Tax=Amphimedon queenslandica TaxID=400682 RepID=A0A1X7SSN8_AMPQE